jgi:hypothetical protein
MSSRDCLETCDGWISENGDGSLALKVGKYRAPTFTLEAQHIRGYGLQFGVADEEIVNEIAFSYTDTQADYKTLQGDPWRDQDDIDARGKVRSQPFSLTWVQSHTQGRRLSKRKIAKLNAPLRVSLRTTLYGLQALGERWIAIEAGEVISDLGGLVIEVLNMKVDLLKAEVVIDGLKVDPDTVDAWDETTEEGERPTIPDKLVSVAPSVPQNLTAVVDIVSGDFAFVATIDDPGRSDLTFQLQYRVSGTSDAYILTARQSPSGHPPVGKVSITLPATSELVGGATIVPYEVQLRAYAPSGLPSAFSSSAITPEFHD